MPENKEWRVAWLGAAKEAFAAELASAGAAVLAQSTDMCVQRRPAKWVNVMAVMTSRGA